MTVRHKSGRYSGAMVLLMLATAMGTAGAETLQGALTKAYHHNPTLTGARASQRAADENVPIQKAAGRPSAYFEGQYQEQVVVPSRAFLVPDRQASGTATLDIPVYQGGAVKNGVRAARVRAEEGRANLRGTEASIFSQVVAAYMDVIRDGAVVALNIANVRALDINFQSSSERFEVGDLTRTDVAQSQSRLALARADLQSAEANLITSRENYVALVGTPPDDLQPPPPLPDLPASAETAVQIALTDNPEMLAAEKRREAARYDVRVATAGVLPTIAGFAQGSFTHSLGSLDTSAGQGLPNLGGGEQADRQAVAGAKLAVPLYQGGRPAARVRQSRALESRAMEQVIEVERNVVALTRSAYANWQAALQTIHSNQAAVTAANLSLEGVRAENSVGSRTILDILNAEQEALNANVRLVVARRDSYVAGFSLLAAMGRAQADDLNLVSGTLYDSQVNYERVEGKWSDWDFDPAVEVQATRTSGIPLQNAKVSSPSAQPETDVLARP